MPYITTGDRYPLDQGLRSPQNAGELNYQMTKAAIAAVADPALLEMALATEIKRFLALKGTRYCYINDIIGALVCCKLEFYRRTGIDRFDAVFDRVAQEFYLQYAGPYEDTKVVENGDVFPDSIAALTRPS